MPATRRVRAWMAALVVTVLFAACSAAPRAGRDDGSATRGRDLTLAGNLAHSLVTTMQEAHGGRVRHSPGQGTVIETEFVFDDGAWHWHSRWLSGPDRGRETIGDGDHVYVKGMQSSKPWAELTFDNDWYWIAGRFGNPARFVEELCETATVTRGRSTRDGREYRASGTVLSTATDAVFTVARTGLPVRTVTTTDEGGVTGVVVSQFDHWGVAPNISELAPDQVGLLLPGVPA